VSRTVRGVSWDLTGRRTSAVRPSPVFLGVVGVAVAAGVLAWRDNGIGSRSGDFAVFVMVIALWIVSLSLHEFAHSYAAYRAGDRDVEAAGYLTLNPLRYAHPVLSILLPVLFIVAYGFGLPGGAVYLHRNAFRSRASQSIAAAAGPLVNLAFAIGTLAVVHAELPHSNHPRFWAGLAFFGLLQVTAAVFNLLPVPGLDGWAIIEPYLSPETQRGAEPVKPWGLLGVFVLLQVQQVNTAFFNLVYRVYEISGLDRLSAEIGRQVFRFWQKQPL